MTATQETQAKPMVLAEQVCQSFGALRVPKGVTLQVDKGQVLVLVGPSGWASRRSCAASTIWSGSMRAAHTSTAS